MWHTVPGRDKDEVKDFVLERLRKRVADVVDNPGLYEHDDEYYSILHGLVEEDIVDIDWEDRDALRTFLEEDMVSYFEQVQNSELTLSNVDVLSIYTDAWGLYCLK